MVMSREQTAGLSHTVKVDNRPIERVEQFKYLGTTLTNQNSIQECGTYGRERCAQGFGGET